MAGQKETPLLPMGFEVANLVQPLGAAEIVQNFIRTRDGTLGPVRGPAPLIPDYGQGLPSYGTPHGIFHCRLMDGRRDVTLCHHGARIDVHNGPGRSLTQLVGAVGSGALLETDLPNLDGPQYPTQFVSTPDGVVIMPAGSRAFFYDGRRIEYLGYASAPSAPIVWGPTLTGSTDTLWGLLPGTLHADFGYGRLGTISNEHGDNTLLRGAYEYAVRWVDCWGNLSPLSPRSNAVQYAKNTPGSGNAEAKRPVAYMGSIDRGPRHTRGRHAYRTKDLEHKGTSELFYMPNAAGGNITGAFATIPDNSSISLPDNTPDSWLSAPAIETDPMPRVNFGFMAFGRMFYGDAQRPGDLIYTLPGRWGTPAKDGRISPDPRGGALRGGVAFGGVAVIWTDTTTFIVEPYQDNSPGFRVYTLHPSVGGVGPGAHALLGDGSLVSLARDRFYRWTGERKPARISDPISRTIESLNGPRLRQACAAFDPVSREFRCWVTPAGQIENTLCLIYDTEVPGWRRRDGEAARSVCVTQDHRRYMLAAAYVSSVAGMWVLDHQDPTYTEPVRTYRIRTGWLANPKRASLMTMNFYGREGYNSAITANSYRDYRDQVVQDSGKVFGPNQPEDTPSTWGTATWGTSTRWVRRRVTQFKIDFYVPSATATQIDIASTGSSGLPAPWEFVGLSVEYNDQPSGGRKERPA